jgi:hypothetical protein
LREAAAMLIIFAGVAIVKWQSAKSQKRPSAPVLDRRQDRLSHQAK